MANLADTLYRVYGGTKTLMDIEGKIREGMSLTESVIALGMSETAIRANEWHMNGEVCSVHIGNGFADIESTDAWSVQVFFLAALRRLFRDDPEFKVEFRSEEPGCDCYVTNVEGAIFGMYLSDCDGEEECHDSLEDMGKRIAEYLNRENNTQIDYSWGSFEQMKQLCDLYNECNPRQYVGVHKFTVEDF